MSWLGRLRLLPPARLRKDRFESEMDEELRFHLESQIEDRIRAGMNPDEARRAVLLSFGGLDKTKEECREVRAFHFLDTLWQDLCYGIRIMRGSPGVTAVAVLSFALAIGPNAALFSIVDNVFLRPSPVKKADEVVSIYFKKGEKQPESLSYPDFVDLRRVARTVRDLLAYEKMGAFLTIQGQRQLTSVQVVSENYFSMIGVNATLGRILQSSDATVAGPPPVVISYGLWQRSFGADPAIIGREIVLNGRGFTVVGVMPREFHGLSFRSPGQNRLRDLHKRQGTRRIRPERHCSRAGQPGAFHRQCQCGRSVACPIGGTAAGNCRPPGPGRKPCPPDSPVVDRVRASRIFRCSSRASANAMARRRGSSLDAANPDAGERRCAPGFPGHRIHDDAGYLRQHAIWHPTGFEGDEA